jgi:solute carrier family 35 protein F1/2
MSAINSSADIGSAPVETIHVQSKKGRDYDAKHPSADGNSNGSSVSPIEVPKGLPASGQEILEVDKKQRGWFDFIKTPQFWIVLALGQVLSLCDTGTNTFTTELALVPWSIPTLQNEFNYILMTLVYTTFTIYKYGFKNFFKLLWKDGWRYILLSFMDVEGNFFTVLAYRYTTILSAQLIEFWAIVVVVIISFVFLHVRYHITQYMGIIVCIGGMGILIASDHITGANGGTALDAVKGDLFALAGATCYGLSNVFEEFLVSKRPMYEVIGMLGMFGIIINGITMAAFDRGSFSSSVWEPKVGGYLTGYTLILFLFYTLVPVMFRLSSAAFFNISLLTGNFWGTAIGVSVFGDHIHWMYPIAFVLIIIGLVVYFISESFLGESRKPWLGENQEGGIVGLGTARRRAEMPSVIV